MDLDKSAISRVLIEVSITFFYTVLVDSSSALVFFSVYVIL